MNSLRSDEHLQGGKGEQKYRVPVSTGIFEHYTKIGDAIWLLLWAIDKTTDESKGEGRVLGGRPVRDADIAGAFRCSSRTIRRWRARLVRGGYLRARRTPFGHVFTVLKSKKWPGQTAKIGQSERTKMAIGSNPNGQWDRPIRPLALTDSGQTKKTGHYKSVMTDSLTLSSPTWKRLRIAQLPVRYQPFVELIDAHPLPADADTAAVAAWGQERLQECDERGIEYPKVFLKRVKEAEREPLDMPPPRRPWNDCEKCRRPKDPRKGEKGCTCPESAEQAAEKVVA